MGTFFIFQLMTATLENSLVAHEQELNAKKEAKKLEKWKIKHKDKLEKQIGD